MLLHQYDSLTGQYVHSFLADPDPRNEDRWLEPAATTPVPLPGRERLTWPFFKDGAWILVPDYRGLVLYRQDNGEQTELLVAGIAPEEAGLTTMPRPSDDFHWMDGAWVVNAEAVARKEREKAMREFEERLAVARARNAGKADAYAVGLLDAVGIALFKAWSTYQMDLVRVLEAPGFPAEREWPAAPDESAITLEAEAAEAARLAGEAEKPAEQDPATR